MEPGAGLSDTCWSLLTEVIILAILDNKKKNNQIININEI